MKTLLVFPPASDPAHPPLGIAVLAGYLREKGEVVDLLDLNVGSYHYLLSRENMERCRDRIDGRLAELDSRNSLSARDAEEYRLLAQSSMSAEYLIDAVGGAIDGLRQPAAVRVTRRLQEGGVDRQAGDGLRLRGSSSRSLGPAWVLHELPAYQEQRCPAGRLG